jgi:hypothetical protein
MLSLAFALSLQSASPFVLVDEDLLNQPPYESTGKVYTVEARIIGRLAKVIFDTKIRALPFQHEYQASQNSTFDFGIKGLPKGGKRAFSNPEDGTFIWIHVLEVKSL